MLWSGHVIEAGATLLSLGAVSLAAPSETRKLSQQLVREPTILNLKHHPSARHTASLEHVILDKTLRDYSVDVQLGDQHFDLIFDTGCADTWVASSNFSCLDINNKAVPQSTCNFGPLFQGDYSHGVVHGQHVNLSYEDPGKTFVLGSIGYEDVTVAGVKVKKQKISIADRIRWQGDGRTSGILGMDHFRGFTQAFAGDAYAPHNDSYWDNEILYDPFFSTAVKQGLDPLWSLTLERGSSSYAGQVILGSLPPSCEHLNFVSAPLLVVAQLRPNLHTLYAIHAEGLHLADDYLSFPSNAEFAVDTGLPYLGLPAAAAEKVNAAFEPPAKYVPDTPGTPWHVDCNAKAPDISYKINGTDFKIDGADLVISAPGADFCYSPVLEFPQLFLGNTFLKNVVTVVDTAKNELRFAPRDEWHASE